MPIIKKRLLLCILIIMILLEYTEATGVDNRVWSIGDLFELANEFKLG